MKRCQYRSRKLITRIDEHFAVQFDVPEDGKGKNDEGDIGDDVEDGHGNKVSKRSVAGI